MNFIFFTKYLFIFLFLVFGFQLHSASAHQDENSNEIIIHIDENGFEPNEIHIKPGTTVIFENVGKEEHWPASDNHPSHTLYANTSLEEHCKPDSVPTFDSCGAVAAGQSWSFVFDKVGTHGYHDHLWPHLNGEIVVEDMSNQTIGNNNIFPRFLDFLRKILYMTLSFFVNDEKNISLNSGNAETQFYEKLKDKYENIVIQSDPREAIDALRQDSLQDEKVSALCHDMLHGIGHAAFNKYGSFKKAVQYQSDFCNSGYIHGLFESYFKSVGNPLTDLSEQCSEYASDKRPFDLWQCYHGIGHGFMYLTGGDLDESLELCQKALEKEAVASCQNGVFMEVFNLEPLAKEKDFIDSKNPFLTCSTRNIAKADCYAYIPTYLSQTEKKDFSDIFKECDKAEFGYKSSCIGGVGAEAIKRNMNNTGAVFTLCGQAGSFINQELCVEGVVSMYMNQEGSSTSGEKLCENAPSNYKDMCNRTVSIKKSFFR